MLQEEMAVPSNAAETMDSDDECSSVDDWTPDKYQNWREDAGGLLRIYDYALRNNILTDVTFNVGPEAKQIHAHRLILALGSPVFEAMFFGEMSEKGNVIAISDVSPEGFQCLLEYIYSERYYFQHEKEAFDTYVAADMFGVPFLRKRCEGYIYERELSPDNVWSFLDHSLLLNIKAVTKKCLTFLKSHTKLSLQSSSFLETSKEAVEHILALDTMEINEYELLKSIVHWAEAKALGEESVKEVLIPLLRHIQFGTLQPNDFCIFLEESGRYLNNSDSLAILKHLIKPSSHSLPAWCCTKVSRNLQALDQCS